MKNVIKILAVTSIMTAASLGAAQAMANGSVTLDAVPSHTITVEGGNSNYRVINTNNNNRNRNERRPYINPEEARERREFPMHSRRIDLRQHALASQIENGFKNGSLDRREYADLKREQTRIHLVESQMKADNRLSRNEIRQLDDLLNRSQSNIRMAMNNNNRAGRGGYRNDRNDRGGYGGYRNNNRGGYGGYRNDNRGGGYGGYRN